ncbi:MAG: P-loop NTPase [Mycoplasmatales bacterium]
MTNEELLYKLNKLYIKSIDKELGEFDYILEIDIEDDRVSLLFNNFSNDEDLKHEIKLAVAKLIKIDIGFPSLKFAYDEQENTQARKPVTTVSDNTKVVAIASGKGGVGKSQVTVNIARLYNDKGFKVAIIDADIYGFSIPKILNLYATPTITNGLVKPLEIDGMQVISAQYFIEGNENKSINWRGAMLTNLVKQFFYDVNWDQDLDYIFIDMPPGTGDIYMDIPILAPQVEMILVTTASLDAAHVAIRVGLTAQELHIPIIGVIENMSYYEIDYKKHYIFGEGGGKSVCDTLSLPHLGQIPITQDNDTLKLSFENIYNKIK